MLRAPTPRPPVKYPEPAVEKRVEGLVVPIPTFPLSFTTKALEPTDKALVVVTFPSTLKLEAMVEDAEI